MRAPDNSIGTSIATPSGAVWRIMSANNAGTPASPTAAAAASSGRRRKTSELARVLICQVTRDSRSARIGTSRVGK